MNYKINKNDLMLVSEDPIKIEDKLVLHPKKDIKNTLDTEISKVNLISPKFVDTVVKKKLKLQLERVIAATLLVLEDEDEDPGVVELALDEAAKFQAMLIYKYEQFLSSDYVELQHGKLKKVLSELKRKRSNVQNLEAKTSRKGR